MGKEQGRDIVVRNIDYNLTDQSVECRIITKEGRSANHTKTEKLKEGRLIKTEERNVNLNHPLTERLS